MTALTITALNKFEIIRTQFGNDAHNDFEPN